MTRMNRGMYSSKDDCATTPRDLFETLDREFHFEVDVCATPETALCKKFWTPEDNCLSFNWGRTTCFMNPPYGKKIRDFMLHALLAARHGATVVCLVPARTDTKWWHDTCWAAQEWRFIKGRLKFGSSKGEPKSNAPFPSAIVIFRPRELGEEYKPLVVRGCNKLGEML